VHKQTAKGHREEFLVVVTTEKEEMTEKLEATLLACTMPDTATIRQAEEALQKLLRGKGSVPMLVRLVHDSQHVAVRQLSAVLLRVKLGMHWMKLAPQDQEFCKKTLLQALLKEPVRTVKVCICYAVSSLASHQLSIGANGWPDLLLVIKQATTDVQNAENRELGYLILYTLTETIGTSLRASLPELADTFREALRSERDPKVYMTILRATASLMEFLAEEEEVMLFQPVLTFLLDALAKGDFGRDDFAINSVVQVVELISVLSESPLPILDSFIVPVCVVLSNLASTPSVHAAIRSAAASGLSDVMQCKSRMVAKNVEANKAALNACVSLCREAAQQSSVELANVHNEEESLDDEEDGILAIKDMTEMVVTAFATSMPTKLVVETLLNSAAGMIQQEVNQVDREAGLIVLIIASEGIASELVESHANAFDHLVVMVLDCITRPDQSIGTMKHALLLLGQWAEYIWPLMEPHAAVVLPACIRLSNTYHEVIFPAANHVLQQYCGAMEEEDIAPYVDDIVVTALNLFAPERRKSPATVRSAIETLSYSSIAAGSKFAPHFDRCLQITSPLMVLVGPEYSEVRAHATALMGTLSVVSKRCTPEGAVNPFLMHVPELLMMCFESLANPDIADLDYRDSVHHLFGNVGIALGVEVERYLPQMVEILIADAVSDDNDVLRKVVDRDGGVANIPESLKAIAADEGDEMSNNEDGDDDDDEDDDDVGNKKVMTSVREAAADSKASALSALESLCDVFSSSDLPGEVVAKTTLVARLMDIVNVCCKTIDEYLHPAVRANAVATLGSALVLGYKAELPANVAVPSKADLTALANATLKDVDFDLKWLPGVSLAAYLPHTVQLANETVVPYLLESMSCDLSKEVAAKACETMDRIAQLTGCSLIATDAREIVETLVILLRGEAACQRDDERLEAREGNGDEEGDDDDEDDEDRRHDEVLLDSIVEALANVSRAIGREAFQPLFELVVPILVKRGKPKMPLQDRVDAVGSLSQLVVVAGRIPGKWGPKIAQVAIEALKEQNDSCVRRNGLVLCGALIEIQEKSINPVTVLGHLKTVFAEHSGSSKHRRWEIEDDLAVMDNACSLICRLLRYSTLTDDIRARVLADFLPFLPLKFDHEEDWIVYSTLSVIAESCAPGLLPEMLRICLLAIDDVTGQGSVPALLRLCEVVGARMGADKIPQELVQKMVTKRQQQLQV